MHSYFIGYTNKSCLSFLQRQSTLTPKNNIFFHNGDGCTDRTIQQLCLQMSNSCLIFQHQLRAQAMRRLNLNPRHLATCPWQWTLFWLLFPILLGIKLGDILEIISAKRSRCEPIVLLSLWTAGSSLPVASGTTRSGTILEKYTLILGLVK